MSGYPIPHDALLADRLGWTGTSGSGKTYNCGSAIERVLHAGARAIVVDPLGVWWGLRLNAEGDAASRFKVVIFGGPHGDLPLNEHAGALIGETVAGMAESCILDLSELGTKAGERRFMLGFLTALNRHASKEPLHLVFDEADMWAPQQLRDKEGEAAKLLGMMETIVRRGRIKGFIPWLITQRPAVLNKDILSQVDGLVTMKLTSSQDRNAIGGWVEGQADEGQWDEIWAALPTLPRGEGFVWIPGRGQLERAAFPKKATFDSSKTPERGQRRSDVALKPLDVEKLKGRLAKVVDEAKANDPTALKSQVATLKRELEAERKKKTPAAAVGGIGERELKAAIRKANEAGFANGVATARGVVGEFAAKALAPIIETLKELPMRTAGAPALARLKPPDDDAKEINAQALESLKTFHASLNASGLTLRDPSGLHKSSSQDKRSAAPARRANGSGGGGASLGKGERACLIAIAQHDDGVTPEQLTVLTGYKRSSRNTYLQRLSSAGLIDKGDRRLIATEAGIAALGDDFEPLPTGDALREHVLQTLPEGERRCLEHIISVYPGAMDPDALSEATGYQRSSRNTYLQRLASRELVVRTPGGPRASANLFD